MRMGVAGIMELIAALTVGMGLARFEYVRYSEQTMPFLKCVAEVKSSFFAGVVVMAGIGLVVESIRRRGQGLAWGIGRWIWALAAISFVLGGTRELIEDRIRSYAYLKHFDWIKQILGMTYQSAVSASVDSFDELVVVFALTSWLAGSRSGTPADAREWGGRAFGLLLVSWWVYSRVRFVADML